MCETRRPAGVLLTLLPAAIYGGVSLLMLLINDPAYITNPLAHRSCSHRSPVDSFIGCATVHGAGTSFAQSEAIWYSSNVLLAG